MHFQSGGFDLGLYDQAVWQYKHFLWPFNTVKERFILGDHLTLTLPLMSFLFFLWEDTRALLIFQSTWICVSVIGIFLIAEKRLKSSFISLVLAVIYSLFYGIQYAIFFDFHPVVFGVGLLVWVIWATGEKKRWLAAILIALLVMTQENMGLALAWVGIMYLFRKEYRKTGALYIGIGLISSLIAAKAISYFSPVGFQYSPEITLNPIVLVTRLFDTEEKRQVWLYTMASVSFVPLLSLGGMAAILAELAQYFVTGNEFSRMCSPFMHHRIILAVLVILGVIDVLERYKKRKMIVTGITILLFVSAIAQQYIFHFPLNKLVKREFIRQEQWMRDDLVLISSIPSDFSIATQQNFVPHLSHRKEIYIAWPREHDFPKTKPCGNVSCWWLDFGGKPQYLIVDRRPHQWLTQILETNENFQSAITNMENDRKIVKIRNVGEATLYQIIY